MTQIGPRQRWGSNYSVVASTLALLTALATGAAYALTVTSSDIVNDTIRSVDVKQNALTAKDIDEATLGYPRRLKSGQTVRGVIGNRDNVGTSLGSITALATIPAANDQALGDGNVVVAGGSDSGDASCDGSTSTPTAPKGVVCVYLAHTSNATNIRGLGILNHPFASLWGFRIAWEPTAVNQLSYVEGVWAFTAR
jgi:hypothetical protein